MRQKHLHKQSERYKKIVSLVLYKFDAMERFEDEIL